MKNAIYISGKGTRLKNIFEKNSIVLKEIALIICDNEDSTYLKEYALNYQIEFVFFNSKIKKGRSVEFSNFMLSLFLEMEIDYCYCFGIQILKGELIEVYRNKIINFHPSILPMFPGLKSIDQALQADSTILLGNTAHFIDKGIDTGPIIIQSILPKSDFYTIGYEGILNLQIEMLEFIHASLLANDIFFKEQRVFFSSKSDNSKLFYNS